MHTMDKIEFVVLADIMSLFQVSWYCANDGGR